MNCENCDKQFSKKSNLTRHQKLNNCLSKCPHCDVICRRPIHILNCPTLLNARIQELELKNQTLMFDNTNLTAQIVPMRIRNTQLEMDNERYIAQITKLQDEMQKQILELSKEVKKANKKKQCIINNNNIKIENLTILNTTDFTKFSDLLTMDHIKRGALGYAEFATNFPLNNKIICTDLSRKKIKYKTSKNELKSDVNMRCITKDLFQSINERNKKLIFDYAKNTIDVIENTEEKMMAYEKFMKYISLIRDGAQGIDHSLYPDFVREVCMMSV